MICVLLSKLKSRCFLMKKFAIVSKTTIAIASIEVATNLSLGRGLVRTIPFLWSVIVALAFVVDWIWIAHSFASLLEAIRSTDQTSVLDALQILSVQR